jgi:hypothetical protein
MPDASTVTQSTAQNRITVLAENLWFPALFFFGFLFCYLLPFHAPEPHHVKVTVSPPAAAAEIGAGLDAQTPGAFDIIPASDAAQARKSVLDRHADAAYAVAADGRSGTLYTAKASGVYVSEAVTAVFTPLAWARHTALSTVELVPTAPGDVTGTGLFYLAMIWNVVPYTTVMMLMRATSLSHRAKLLTLAAVGAFVSVVGYLIAHAMDVVPGEPLAILYGFLTTQAVAWTVYGLVPFVRQYIPGVAVTLFVLLSIPSSGGAIPWQMVPAFFRWLHPVMPLGNLIDALRVILYFDDKELLRPTLVLGGWILLGMALVVAGALLRRRKRRDDDSDEPGTTEPIEDPILNAPTAHAVRPATHGGAFGDNFPTLHGSATDDEGRPVEGAIVTVTDTRGRQLLRARTDALGRYAVAGLPEDVVTVILSAPHHTPAVAQVLPITGHELRRDFILLARH